MSLRSRFAVLASLALATGVALVLLPTTSPAESGGIDNGYGTNGSTLVPTPAGTSTFNDSIKLGDGSVVAVGSTGLAGARDVLVAKFTPGGQLDSGFGTGGVLTFDATGTDVDAALDVSVAPGGALFLAGTREDPGAGQIVAGFVARITGAGVLDTTWNAGGPVPGVTIDAFSLASYDAAIQVSATDYVFAGGDHATTLLVGRAAEDGDWTGVAPAWNTAVVLGAATSSKYVSLQERSDGTYVAVAIAPEAVGGTFVVSQFPAIGPATDVQTVYADATDFTDATILTDDSILATGGETVGATPQRGAVWKFDPSGALDATYGTAGKLSLPAATGGWIATGLAIDSTNRTYVLGNVGANEVRTVRLSSTNALDTTFGDDNGYADRVFGSSPTRVASAHIDSSDRPVAVGSQATQAATWRVERFNYASTSLGSVTFSPSFVQRLNTMTWSYSVTNGGPDRSGVVTVDIDIPATFESQAFSPSTGSVATAADGSGGLWTIPQLASGATATLTLTGKPGATGTLTSTATIQSQASTRVGAAPVAKSASATVFGAATPRDDVIFGTPQDDTIDALAGNDYVYGRGSDDTLSGNVGNDSVYGEAGDDIVRGDDGDDRLFGGIGNDLLSGGNGVDALDGGPGKDRLFGGAGNDLLKGASGNDRLEGGPGNDKLLGGVGDDYLIAQFGVDLLIGGPGKDRLDGSQANDILYGGTGGDFINGKTGSDKIFGEQGNDWLRGFGGNDRIDAGSGNDLLNGGAGKDAFLAGAGNDIVRADDGRGGDRVNCGSGWDLVYANEGDTLASNCEFVKYDVPAGTAA